MNETEKDLESLRTPEDENAPDGRSLNDMLQELRILLQGAQVLTAFLVVLPFNQSFGKIHPFEKWVFIATFMCSVASLVFFSAPAAHHRLIRPLIHRVTFKLFATRMILVGLVFLSLALVLVTQLVVWQVMETTASIFVTAFVGILIILVWWLFPIFLRRRV
ncbi:MAG: DUF6328 family protein [Bacteroidetes bacterium]|nr:DUF6328 family protein [Bacteroidota bacterium]